MNQFIKIALIGATGKAGQSIATRLTDKGYRIKVLLRNPGKFEMSNPLVEKVIGNILDYSSVYSLVEGCDLVISALGQRKGEEPVFAIAARNLIRAMNELNVKRYITITGLTLDVNGDKKSFRTRLLTRIMKWSFPDIIKDKREEFSLISQSGLDWTVVRLPSIKQTESLGKLKISLTDCPGKVVSTTDLADFLVEHLSEKQFYRKAPFVAN